MVRCRLGEELGWSGYAIDPMQRLYNNTGRSVFAVDVTVVWVNPGSACDECFGRREEGYSNTGVTR